MPEEVPVGTVQDFDEVDRKIVSLGGAKIGVFKVDGVFYAYENRCMHQGGPVCEGEILGKVEAVLEDDLNVLCERLSNVEKNLVCPWHGYEYDLKTGEAAGDPRLKLNAFDVVERNGTVYLLA